MDTSMIPTNFYAKKGQKLKVKLTGGNVETYLWGNQLKDSINLGEYSPELDDNGIYILPASGEYEIRGFCCINKFHPHTC